MLRAWLPHLHIANMPASANTLIGDPLSNMCTKLLLLLSLHINYIKY